MKQPDKLRPPNPTPNPTKDPFFSLLSTNVLLLHHQENFSTNKRKNTHIEGCSVYCQKERNIWVGRTHSIQQQHHDITVVTITVMSIYLSVTLPFPQPYYHRLKLKLPKSNHPISAAITKTKTAKDRHYRTHWIRQKKRRKELEGAKTATDPSVVWVLENAKTSSNSSSRTLDEFFQNLPPGQSSILTPAKLHNTIPKPFAVVVKCDLAVSIQIGNLPRCMNLSSEERTGNARRRRQRRRRRAYALPLFNEKDEDRNLQNS